MKGFIVLFIVLFMPFVLAEGNINYTLVEEKVLVEMDIQVEDNFEFFLPLDYSAFQINSQNYTIQKGKLTIPKAQHIELKYITKSQIEKSSKKYFFIAKNELHRDKNITVYLPQGAVILENYIIFPKNYLISSDGQKIILQWVNDSEKEIFVPYVYVNELNFMYYFIIFLIFGIFLLFFYKKQKTKKLTTNLFREEKKIMGYLILNKECWTKDIVKKLGISKVRLSRKLRKLEEKGLIEKIPYGNENKVILKK